MARPNMLDRFRAGAPGAAGPAGVPASDDLGPVAELSPVFSALSDDVGEVGGDLLIAAGDPAEGYP